MIEDILLVQRRESQVYAGLQGFAHLDGYYASDYDSSNAPHFNLSYVGWFVTICVLEGFGDDFCENDTSKLWYERVPSGLIF